MKTISRIVLVIFSLIIIFLGVAINLLAVGWLEYDTAFKILERALIQKPSSQIILISSEICMLFAIICIFMDSPERKEPRGGQDILLQNDNGKLMISRTTIENLVNSTVSKFVGVKESNSRIAVDETNNVNVLVDLTVTENVVIKELTVNLQNKIKETIKKTSDLEVKEVNVRVKNIDNKPIDNAE